MAMVIGYSCVLNFCATESGSYDKIDLVKEAALSMTIGEADTTTRDSNRVKLYLPTLIDFEIGGSLIKNAAPLSNWHVLRGYALSGTVFFVQALDAVLSGNGMQGPVFISKWDDSEPIDDIATTSFTLKPAYYATGTWQKVDGGSAGAW